MSDTTNDNTSPKPAAAQGTLPLYPTRPGAAAIVVTQRPEDFLPRETATGDTVAVGTDPGTAPGRSPYVKRALVYTISYANTGYSDKQIAARLRTLSALRIKQYAGGAFPYHFDRACMHHTTAIRRRKGLAASALDLRLAATEYESALAYDPSDHPAIAYLVEALLSLAEIEGSFDTRELQSRADQLLAANLASPLIPRFWRPLAEARRQLGDAAAAAEALDRTLSAEPLSAHTHLDAANLHFECGDLPRAISSLRHADRSEPGNPKILALLGWAYHRAGLRARAARSFRASLDVPYYRRNIAGPCLIEFDAHAVYAPARELLGLLAAPPEPIFDAAEPALVYRTGVYHLRLRDEAAAFGHVQYIYQELNYSHYADKISDAVDHFLFEPEQRAFPLPSRRGDNSITLLKRPPRGFRFTPPEDAAGATDPARVKVVKRGDVGPLTPSEQ